MAAKVSPKIALNFKRFSPSEKVTFSRAVIASLTGSTVFTTFSVTLAILGTQTDTLESIEEKFVNRTKVSGDKQLRDDAADDVDISLTAIAHDIELKAWNTSGKQELVAEQLMLTTGFHIADKATHKARTMGLVAIDSNSAQIRAAKTKPGLEIVHWEFGITTAKDVPPVNKKRHTCDNVDLIITNLRSGMIIGIHKAGGELMGKVKKYQHPSIDINADEQLAYEDWYYFVVP